MNCHLMLFACRLKVAASQVSDFQGEMRMHELQWSGREQGYQKAIKKLEAKVTLVIPSLKLLPM